MAPYIRFHSKFFLDNEVNVFFKTSMILNSSEVSFTEIVLTPHLPQCLFYVEVLKRKRIELRNIDSNVKKVT